MCLTYNDYCRVIESILHILTSYDLGFVALVHTSLHVFNHIKTFFYRECVRVRNVCRATYLLQEDVFIDDSLVPLGVETLACMFGPPLVFSTGGTHHNKILLVTDMQKSCRLVGHHNAVSTI